MIPTILYSIGSVLLIISAVGRIITSPASPSGYIDIAASILYLFAAVLFYRSRRRSN